LSVSKQTKPEEEDNEQQNTGFFFEKELERSKQKTYQ
jgi:hypothetical protein